MIGIHSAKFTSEKSSASVRQAVLRLGIEYPVVIDPLLEIRDRYTVRTWPTQVLIDPQGRIVQVTSGEFLAEDFKGLRNSRFHRPDQVFIYPISQPLRNFSTSR